MLKDIHRLSALFESALPPYATHGPVKTYYDHSIEFILCAHFGRLDVFHQRHFGTDESAKRPFTAILQEFKQTKPDDETIAQGMVMCYLLGRRIPVSPEAAAQTAHYFSEILKNSPSMEERVVNYFTKQRAFLNYGESSHRAHRPAYYSNLPDRTLSTQLLYQHTNPRTSLIAAMLDGVTFEKDGMFFEGANFRAADMRRTLWHPSTSIKGAFLEGADLSGSIGLENEDLAQCYIDASTRLPSYLNRSKIMKMHDDLGLPAAPPFTALEEKFMPSRSKQERPAPSVPV